MDDDRFDFDHCTCFDTLGPEGYPPPRDPACPEHTLTRRWRVTSTTGDPRLSGLVSG